MNAHLVREFGQNRMRMGRNCFNEWKKSQVPSSQTFYSLMALTFLSKKYLVQFSSKTLLFIRDIEDNIGNKTVATT